MEAECVADLIKRIECGDQHAFGELVSLVYTELRSIAGSLLRGQLLATTLQPTALVNEAYLRLVKGSTKWESKAHFFGAAARAMRQVLIARIRQRSAKKRLRWGRQTTLSHAAVQVDHSSVDVCLLDEALTALAAVDERLVRVIELRYFAGCTLQEVSHLMGHSLATVKRDWTYARAWLYDYMNYSARGMEDEAE